MPSNIENCSRVPFDKEHSSLSIVAIRGERSAYAEISRLEEIAAGKIVYNIRQASRAYVEGLSPSGHDALWNKLSRKSDQVPPDKNVSKTKIPELISKHARRQSGFCEARDRLASSHLELAEIAAARYAERGIVRGITLGHLQGVARVGLLKAAERFNPDNGYFAEFAFATMDGEIKREFRDYTPVGEPRARIEGRTKVRKVQGQLATKLGRPPSAAEIAAELNSTRNKDAPVTAGWVQGVLLSVKILSTDDWNEDTGSGINPDGIYFHDPTQDPEGQAIARVDLKNAFKSLSHRERAIVIRYYWAGQSQTTISKALNISQMQVSRIINKALSKLERHMGVEDESSTAVLSGTAAKETIVFSREVILERAVSQERNEV